MATLLELQAERANIEARKLADTQREQAIEQAIENLSTQPVHDVRIVGIVTNAIESLLLPLGDHERAAVLGAITGLLAAPQIASAQAYADACARIEGEYGPNWAQTARDIVSKGAIPFLGSAMQDAMAVWAARSTTPAMTVATAQPAKVQAVVAGHKSDSQGRVVYNKSDKATWTATMTAKKIAHLPDGRAVDVSAATSLNRIGLLVTAAQRNCTVADVGSQGNQGFRMTPAGKIVYHVPEGEVTFS